MAVLYLAQTVAPDQGQPMRLREDLGGLDRSRERTAIDRVDGLDREALGQALHLNAALGR